MAKKSKPETKETADAVVYKTKDIAEAMGISPKALRKLLRANDTWNDHKYTHYRFTSVQDVVSVLRPTPAA